MENTDKEEILSAISALSKKIGDLDGKIDGVDSNLSARIDGVDSNLSARIDGVDSSLSARIDGVDSSLSAKVESLHGEVIEAIQMLSTHTDEEFEKIRNEMASKDQLDRKVDGLEMGIVSHVARVDEKDTALVVSLMQKGIVDSFEKETIIAMSPFPARG